MNNVFEMIENPYEWRSETKSRSRNVLNVRNDIEISSFVVLKQPSYRTKNVIL